MAAVIAKNAVGSSWRKVVGSREWSRVPGALSTRGNGEAVDGGRALVRSARLPTSHWACLCR